MSSTVFGNSQSIEDLNRGNTGVTDSSKKYANVLIILGSPKAAGSTYETKSTEGETIYSGFTYTLWKRIKEYLSDNYEFNEEFRKVLNYGKLVDELVANKYDIVVGLFYRTPERLDKINFTTPIVLSQNSILTLDKINYTERLLITMIDLLLGPMIFLLAMSIGPNLKWIKSDIKNKKTLIKLFILSLVLSAFIIQSLDVKFLVNTILVGSAFYLFFISIKDFLSKNYKNNSQILAHFGFSLLILSILFNNFFTKEIIVNLKVGETYISENLNINFKNKNQKDEKNFKSITGKFELKYQNGKTDTLEPELRIYNQPNIITSEADIKTNLFRDKFMTINYVKNQDFFNVRYQEKPFMIWIWLSVILIGFSGVISLFKIRYEN